MTLHQEAWLGPSWFEWLSLLATVVAAAAPALLAITLFGIERRDRIAAERAIAARIFTSRLERLDAVGLVYTQSRYVGEFYLAMGDGTRPLMDLISQLVDLASDGAIDRQIDLSIDVADLISRWQTEGEWRADLIEVYLANGDVALVAEDNLIVTPSSRKVAEHLLLKDRSFREWLRGTRLSRTRTRLRRVWRSLRTWELPPKEPLNAFATRSYLIGGEQDRLLDTWLSARLHEP